jgi:glycosyltransferase involved in cell wall biosynthesis
MPPLKPEARQVTASRPDLNGVSVVVPLRNEAATISVLLHGLLSQSHPPDEVVLVDGGSTDGTAELADRLAAGHPEMRVVRAGPASPGRGRNLGISEATHPWVALTDGGCVPDQDWLEELLQAARAEPTAELVAGNWEPAEGQGASRLFWPAIVPAKRSVGPGRHRGASVASLLLTRRVWEEAGGFPDMRAAEDLLFLEKVPSQKWTWAPRAVVRWEPPAGYAALFRRTRLYSRVNAAAGLQARWHFGVARQYALVLAMLGGLALRKRYSALIPAASLAAALRLARVMAPHAREHGAAWALCPKRLAAVALALGVCDAATFLGWYDAAVTGMQQREKLSEPPATAVARAF